MHTTHTHRARRFAGGYCSLSEGRGQHIQSIAPASLCKARFASTVKVQAERTGTTRRAVDISRRCPPHRLDRLWPSSDVSQGRTVTGVSIEVALVPPAPQPALVRESRPGTHGRGMVGVRGLPWILLARSCLEAHALREENVTSGQRKGLDSRPLGLDDVWILPPCPVRLVLVHHRPRHGDCGRLRLQAIIGSHHVVCRTDLRAICLLDVGLAGSHAAGAGAKGEGGRHARLRLLAECADRLLKDGAVVVSDPPCALWAHARCRPKEPAPVAKE